MNKYKIYLVYIKTDDVADVSPYDLYAYTTSDEIIEVFKKTRNMEKFYIKKKYVTKIELNDLYKKYMNSYLDIYSLSFRNKDYEYAESSIALTGMEKTKIDSISSLMIHEKIYENVWMDDYPLKKKYKKALEALLYSGLHHYITDGGDSLWSETEGKMIGISLPCLFDYFGDLFP